jgi:hypothetical protein
VINNESKINCAKISDFYSLDDKIFDEFSPAQESCAIKTKKYKKEIWGQVCWQSQQLGEAETRKTMV